VLQIKQIKQLLSLRRQITYASLYLFCRYAAIQIRLQFTSVNKTLLTWSKRGFPMTFYRF